MCENEQPLLPLSPSTCHHACLARALPAACGTPTLLPSPVLPAWPQGAPLERLVVVVW